MNEYAIVFPDFFAPSMPNFTSWQRANTASKAKYLKWLSFRDAYDMPFIDFLKICKCYKVNGPREEQTS